MGALRTVRTRVRLLNPAEAPPGATPVSYGDGLTVAASEVSVDFGTGHNQVARGDAAGTIPDGSITGAKLDTNDAAALRTALGLGDAAVRSTGIGGTQVVLGNDSRLSNPRTPTSHTHAASEVGARVEVGLTAAHTIDSGEGGPWYTVGSWRYVASEWDGCTFELRVEGFVTTDGLTGQVRLIRGDTLASAGSTIELDTVPPSNGSAALTLVDGVIYLLQQRFNIGPAGDSFTLLGARIHIVRS